MATGTIKRIVSERGFGFIAGADGTEYFFHRNSVENFDALRGDEAVTFEAEDSPKGPRANQVRLSTEAPAVSEG
jgi:CspA family cold shock protein